jgi:hypothetical protein
MPTSKPGHLGLCDRADANLPRFARRRPNESVPAGDGDCVVLGLRFASSDGDVRPDTGVGLATDQMQRGATVTLSVSQVDIPWMSESPIVTTWLTECWR